MDDPACREALDRFRRAGVLVAAWQTTSDVGIPAFLGVIDEASSSPLRPLPPASSAGCHPSRAVALLRALTKAAQSRLTVIAGARDDQSGRIYESALDEDLDRWLAEQRMTRDGFVRLMIEEAQVRWVQALFTADAQRCLPDWLRVTGEYGPLLARAHGHDGETTRETPSETPSETSTPPHRHAA